MAVAVLALLNILICVGILPIIFAAFVHENSSVETIRERTLKNEEAEVNNVTIDNARVASESTPLLP